MSRPEVVYVVDGMVRCPLRLGDGMARDACVVEQARKTPGCGMGCPVGAAALEAKRAFQREERIERSVREKVRLRYRQEYLGDLARGKVYVPTGRPRGRPPKKPRNYTPRAPTPGGHGPRVLRESPKLVPFANVAEVLARRRHKRERKEAFEQAKAEARARLGLPPPAKGKRAGEQRAGR